MSRVAAFLALVAATASVAPASAQSMTGVPGLSVDVLGTIVYDDNQLRLPDGVPSVAGRRNNGFRYSPSVGVSYSRPIGRQSLTISGLVGRDIYGNATSLSRTRYRAGGSLQYTLGARCTGTVSGGYAVRQNGVRDDPNLPAPDPDVPDDVGQLTNNVQASSNYGATVNCGTGGGLTFGGSANGSSIDNRSSLFSFSDSSRRSYSAFAGLGVLRPGQLSVTGSYSTIDYPNRTSLPGFPPAFLNSGVDTFTVGLSYSRPIGSRLSGSFGVSYLSARPKVQAAYTAPAYNVSLSYRPGSRLSFGLSGSRNVLSSSTAGALFRVVDQVRLNAIYSLGQSITANASAGYTRNNFQGGFSTPALPVPRSKEESKLLGFGLQYAPRPLYDINLNVNKTFRSSQPSLYDYESFRVNVTLGLHF